MGIVKKIRFYIKFKKWNRELFLELLLRIMGFQIINTHLVYLKSLNSKSVILDFGANHGLFSSIVSERFASDTYLFEPNTNLVQKYLLKKFPREKIYEKAISDKEGKSIFFISSNDEASSMQKDFQIIWSIDESIEVDCVTLKSVFDTLQINSVELIKIDIEGAEVDVLKSFSIQEFNKVNQVTVELHDWLNRDLRKETISSIKHMRNLGYLYFTSSVTNDKEWGMLFIKKVNFNVFHKIVYRVYKMFSVLDFNEK